MQYLIRSENDRFLKNLLPFHPGIPQSHPLQYNIRASTHVFFPPVARKARVYTSASFWPTPDWIPTVAAYENGEQNDESLLQIQSTHPLRGLARWKKF